VGLRRVTLRGVVRGAIVDEVGRKEFSGMMMNGMAMCGREFLTW